jgi:hypothetical protein
MEPGRSATMPSQDRAGASFGITPEELAARVNSRYPVSAYELSTWMPREGLAEMRDGCLVATPAGVELGELLSRS